MKAVNDTEETQTQFSNPGVTSFEQLAALAKSKKKEIDLLPHVLLDGFTFELVGFEFLYEWETYPDQVTGEVRRRQTEKLALSDDGTRCKAKVSFIFTDPQGHSTSRKAPFASTKEVSIEDGTQLLNSVGEAVKLLNPRIVFQEKGKGDKYGSIETVMRFAFDGFDF